MKVSAIVVSHGNAAELAESLPALEEQVDELLVIANIPGSVPRGVDALVNDTPLGFAAHVNVGLTRTRGDAVLIANPDAVAEPGAVSTLRDFMAGHERCGVAGPRMVFPDGSPQPSRRRFPTVGGTIVRRTPLRRVVGQEPMPSVRAASIKFWVPVMTESAPPPEPTPNAKTIAGASLMSSASRAALR